MTSQPAGLVVIHLTHAWTKEEATVSVDHAWPRWVLDVRWRETGGVYALDLKADRLKPSRGSRRELLWRCADLAEAKRAWHRLAFPGQHVEDSPHDCVEEMETELKKEKMR